MAELQAGCQGEWPELMGIGELECERPVHGRVPARVGRQRLVIQLDVLNSDPRLDAVGGPRRIRPDEPAAEGESREQRLARGATVTLEDGSAVASRIFYLGAFHSSPARHAAHVAGVPLEPFVNRFQRIDPVTGASSLIEVLVVPREPLTLRRIR